MKKIMFNDKYGLTQAVLEGRKTMTRREIPTTLYNMIDFGTFEDGDNCCVYSNGDWYNIFDCLPYRVGEVVAIAQSYESIFNEESLYRKNELIDIIKSMAVAKSRAGWNNKMFVRAEEMPHHIHITNIRIERLQDISDEDCLREGVLRRGEFFGVKNVGGGYNTARGMFEWLIDKVSCKGTWDSNPWVFVYEFELVD